MPEKRIGNSGANMPGMGTNSVEKSKDMKKAYKNLFRYIGRYRWIILAASVLSVAGAILNLIGPSKLSEVTDLITEGMNSSCRSCFAVAEISIAAGCFVCDRFCI
jgi:ATP-binding cassette subfamily B multidrug efflux pump